MAEEIIIYISIKIFDLVGRRVAHEKEWGGGGIGESFWVLALFVTQPYNYTDDRFFLHYLSFVRMEIEENCKRICRVD